MLRPCEVVLRDGRRLVTYEAGNPAGDLAIIANAPGMPFHIALSLAARLASHMRVVVWDNPGSPDLSVAFDPLDTTIDQQSDAVIAIAAAQGAGRCHLIGWSSGAFVVLDAVQKQATRFATATLVSPNDLASTIRPTMFQEVFHPLFERASHDDPNAIQRLRRYVEASQQIVTGRSEEEQHAQALATVFARDSESTRRYAHYFARALQFRDQARHLFHSLSAQLPMLIVHAKDDAMTDYRDSVLAFEEVRTAKLLLRFDGGHYLLVTRAAWLADAIVSHAGDAP